MRQAAARDQRDPLGTRCHDLCNLPPQRLAAARNVIIESNSVLKFLRPDLYLSVLDPATADFKNSAREFLDRADAVILHQNAGETAWQAVSLKPIASQPIFRITPPNYVTPEIVSYVRSKLGDSSAVRLRTGKRERG